MCTLQKVCVLKQIAMRNEMWTEKARRRECRKYLFPLGKMQIK